LQSPEDASALELLGDLSAQQRQTNAAIDAYQAAVKLADPPSENLLDKLSLQFTDAGRVFDTLDVLQQWIELYPNQVQPRMDYVGLVSTLGMADQAVPSLKWLTKRFAKQGSPDPQVLQVLANPHRVEPDPEFCRSLLERYPDDLRPQYSLARFDALELRWEAVKTRLEPVLERHPDYLPAFTLYGRALTELDQFEQLAAWHDRLPSSAETSPEYWLVAGSWAQANGEPGQAARAFWQAAKLDQTNMPEIFSRWLTSLRQIGRNEDAQRVADRIAKQIVLRDALLTHLERSARSQRAAIAVAAAMKDLGRIWEAEAWARIAVSLPEERLERRRERYMEIRSGLTVQSPWRLPETRLAARIDLSDLPRVSWSDSLSNKVVSQTLTRGEIAFEDQAEQRGLVHTCEVAPEAETEGHWIYQSVGGGVGVIDFDLDGWPDVAAAMLDGDPLKTNSSPNRLFRNQQGKYLDCGEAAGYSDRGFAQGIAVGDFNDDGFPDLFDANIGRNRLFRNNGDGTFTEVSLSAGLEGEVWTTSAVVVDIDGDGIADLFETAYCAGTEPYTVECRQQDKLGSCPPLKFAAENDRVYRGLGDGTFVDASEQWLDQKTPGRGLGIVAGMFDERPGIDLYVANDMTANHLWSASVEASTSGKDTAGKQPDPTFQLLDLAAVRGLATSGQFRSQASMGIATGDPDSDGDVDFFLTHFADDHNTFYEQVSPGQWTDRSGQVGLANPSTKLLGFGTEWIDADNNGDLELIVANGHVDEVARSDVSYRMPAQLFRRTPQGRWVELERTQLGDYFQTEHLGRALTTLDANRDGRVDVAITHLYEPMSLLINTTEQSGRSVTFHFKSVSGSRDAIGAKVSATLSGRTVTKQLFAGDGYMCSHQRCVTFGTAGEERIKDVSVTWPSGRTERFGTANTGQDYLLVEGAGEAYSFTQAQP
jgi:tetratricopeptide (TPR) repeat protein